MKMDLLNLCLGALVLSVVIMRTSGQKQEKFVDPDLDQNHQQLIETDDFDFQKPVRPTKRPQKGRDEDEDDIQAGGTKPKPPPATEEGDHVAGSPYKFSYGVDDNTSGNQFSQKVDSDGEVVTGEYRVLLPDGRTQIVTYTADWKNGFRPKYRYEGTIKPWVPPPKRAPSKRPGEEETDIQPGGFTPKKPQPKPTVPSKNVPVKRRPAKAKLPNEEEEDIQPGGFTPAPTRRTTTTTRAPIRVTTRPTVRTTTTTKAPVRVTTRPTVRTTRAPVRRTTTERPLVDEGELQIDSQGFTPKPKPVDPCAPGTMKALLNPNCRKVKCVPGSKDPKCRRPDESEEDIQPGGYLPTKPKCTPGTKNPKCKRPDESEEDIQPGGYLPTGKPAQSDPCARGTTKAFLDPNCRKRDDKARCIAEKKDPKLCFPELCFPGSKHPKCQVKVKLPDENEEDIQPGGFTPAPVKKPSNLYDTPDTPYGVRLNRKFGYEY